VESEEPVRDPKTGFCIRSPSGANGELLGRISDLTSSKFNGYTSKEDTEKKILTDVFVKGDRYFRCGDLVRQEPDGFIYFVDRIGDTFRSVGYSQCLCLSCMSVCLLGSLMIGVLIVACAASVASGKSACLGGSLV
jgi:acyl-CoA synthetase (AMP-forming)/AMP-acid ligase II